MKISKKVIISILAAAVMILSVAAIPRGGVDAATPRVMLTDYDLGGKDIYAGDTFNLKFKLKNTSKNKVMNMKCTVYSENGEFIPVDSAGTLYVAELEGEAETELSLDMQSMKNLKEKSYKLIVKTEYEDWAKSYKVEDTIYVPIRLKTEVKISETYIAEEEIRLGDNIEIISTVNNVGAADIYKVSAEVSGDCIANAECFVGNVQAGKNGNIDIITKATALGRNDRNNNVMTVTYEDVNGEVFTEEVQLGNDGKIDVIEQDYSDVIVVKEDDAKHLTDIEKLGIVIAAVVVVLVVLLILRRMKKRKLEKDFD